MELGGGFAETSGESARSTPPYWRVISRASGHHSPPKLRLETSLHFGNGNFSANCRRTCPVARTFRDGS
jgi:hypothetical protein